MFKTAFFLECILLFCEDTRYPQRIDVMQLLIIEHASLTRAGPDPGFRSGDADGPDPMGLL